MSVNKKVRITSRIVMKFSIRVLAVFIGCLVLYTCCTKAYDFGQLIFTEKGMDLKGNGQEVTITIPEGASSMEVGKILEDNGLIESKYAFFIQTFLYEAKIYPGTYTLNTQEGPEELIGDMKIVEEEKEE